MFVRVDWSKREDSGKVVPKIEPETLAQLDQATVPLFVLYNVAESLCYIVAEGEAIHAVNASQIIATRRGL